MNEMSNVHFWMMVSIAVRGALTVLVIAILLSDRLRRDFIYAERVGMALMAGGSVMTLPILYLETPTPFDGWAGTVMAAGALVYVGGRGFRAARHAWRNDVRNPRWMLKSGGK